MTGKNMVSLKSFCDKHGLDAKHARRLARKNAFAGAVLVLDKYWAIDADADVPVMPPVGTRGTQRADGRARYVVYVADETELASIAAIVGETNVVNPRNVAKQRRIAAKLAAESDTDDNG